jgi:hypothetical protein
MSNLRYDHEIFPRHEGSISLWVNPQTFLTSSAWFFRLTFPTGIIGMGLYSSNIAFCYWGGIVGAVTNLTNGDWHHVVMTKEDGTLKIYVNGVLENSGTTTAVDGTPTADVYFGTGWLTGGGANAIYDEFAVFSRALTADEVRAIYESDAPIFAETSTWSWRTPTNLAWADANGLFARDTDGQDVLGVIGVDSYTWGNFALDAGDIVLGRNVSGKSAIKWDLSSGTFGFYGDGNTDPQVEIGTDGKLLAASGDVTIGSDGIKLLGSDVDAGTAGRTVNFVNDSDTSILSIYARDSSSILKKGFIKMDATGCANNLSFYTDSDSPYTASVSLTALRGGAYASYISVSSAGLGENYVTIGGIGLRILGGYLGLQTITAPSVETSFDLIFIDTADGDLKIKFRNGTVKTIATN